MNMGSLNMANEEVAKELVLLSCIDKNKMKSFQRYFQGIQSPLPSLKSHLKCYQ